MTDISRSLILGVIQGLTEFLPVSSSGHLEIINHLLGSARGVDSDLTMVLVTHFGTALSIFYVFRKDIYRILGDLLKFQNNDNTRLAWEIVISMIPALIIGLAFEEQIESIFNGGIWMVGCALIVTALVLWLTPDTPENDEMIGWNRAAIIGLAQAVAIMPGISRSGMTIAIALMLGVGKTNAARFSFLMVLPVIVGKMILDLVSGELFASGIQTIPLLLALITSFLVGVMACTWMIRIVRQFSLKYFAWYCLVIGLSTIGMYFYG